MAMTPQARTWACRARVVREPPRSYSDRNPLEYTLPKGTEGRLVLREGSMLQGVCDRQVVCMAYSLPTPALISIVDVL